MHGDHTDEFDASVSIHRILAGTAVVVSSLEGKSCQQGFHTQAHKPSKSRAIRLCYGLKASPRSRAAWPKLLIGQAAPDDASAASIRKVQVLRPRKQSERESLAYVEPSSRRCRERVLEAAGRREMNRAATAVGGRVTFEQRPIEEAHAAVVDLHTNGR